jgi:hypothetical protein
MGSGRYIAALLFVSAAADGSTFIAAKQGDAIIVGADSRVTLTIDYKRTQPGSDICKIHKSGKSRYFVIASNQFINTKTGINFSDLATQAFAGDGDPKTLADKFETQALGAAERILKEDAQATVLSVVFFGYDKGPFFYSRSIRRSPIETYKQPEDCTGTCSKWIAGGYHEVIDKLAPRAFSTIRAEDAIPFLITKEIDADKTGGIGLPIALFRLDGTGERWLSPGVCKPFSSDGK